MLMPRQLACYDATETICLVSVPFLEPMQRLAKAAPKRHPPFSLSRAAVHCHPPNAEAWLRQGQAVQVSDAMPGIFQLD